MSDHRTFVIVGANLAGATAAATLREEGFRVGSSSSAPSRIRRTCAHLSPRTTSAARWASTTSASIPARTTPSMTSSFTLASLLPNSIDEGARSSSTTVLASATTDSS